MRPFCYPAARSRLANAAATVPGSSASVSARTTTTRLAPASSTASRRSKLIPPIANHGRAVPSPVTLDSSPSPVPGRPALVGVAHSGPALDAQLPPKVVAGGVIYPRGTTRPGS
jgi:hypothetical protein